MTLMFWAYLPDTKPTLSMEPMMLVGAHLAASVVVVVGWHAVRTVVGRPASECRLVVDVSVDA